MGYTTTFDGKFQIDPPLSPKLADYINRFANVRHMRRNVDEIKKVYPNWKDLCFRCRLGYEGEFLAIKSKEYGQEHTNDIIDYNCPPKTQPGLWCQWVISKTNPSVLKWDGGEQFYNYKEWLEYLIENFLWPNGHVVNGTVRFQGEAEDDKGELCVNNNKVKLIYDNEILPFD